MKRALVLCAAIGAASTAGCSSGESTPAELGPSTFSIQINAVNGDAPPSAASPIPASVGLPPNRWDFTIQAVLPTGEVTTDFNGFVRLSVEPGAVDSVEAPGASGRNVLLSGGTASGTVIVEAVYGPARLWADDIGYVPTPPCKIAQCADGIDNNHNGLIDFPADPGCAFPDDDTEDGGTYLSRLRRDGG